MTCGVTSFVFEDVSLPMAGSKFGSFSGEAEIDVDGAIVAISMQQKINGPWQTLKVPFNLHSCCLTGSDSLVKVLANELQSTFLETIEEKIEEWQREQRGPEYEAAE